MLEFNFFPIAEHLDHISKKIVVNLNSIVICKNFNDKVLKIFEGFVNFEELIERNPLLFKCQHEN